MAKKPVTLKLNGKPLELSNKQKLQQALADIPHGHLLSTNELAAKANVHPCDSAMRHPALNENRRIHNNRAVWGHTTTIQAYDKQMSEAK